MVSHAVDRESKRVRSRRRRILVWVLAAVGVAVLLLVGWGVWVGSNAMAARRDLERAQSGAATLKAQLAAFKSDDAARTYRRLVGDTSDAVQQTDGVLWRAAEGIPWLGKNLTVVRQLAAVTDDTVRALKPAVALASSLNPASLAPKAGAIPLGPLTRAIPVVRQLRADIDSLSSRADAIDASGTISQLPPVQKKLATQLDALAQQLGVADTSLPLLSKMLGADGPRTYIIAFQNNAEARSTGGTLLFFARVSVEGGRIRLVEAIDAGATNFPPLYNQPPIIPIGSFDEVYSGVLGRTIANSTLRPSATMSAQIVQKFWSDYRGVSADAIITIDAVQLSYLLAATGPIRLPTGDSIDQKSVVPFLFNEVYQRYDSGNLRRDNAAQSAVYAAAVGATFARIASGQVGLPALIGAVTKGAAERRFEFYATRPEERTVIARLNLITPSEPPASTPKVDQLGFYVNDYGGTKLDYYLRPSATVQVGQCGAAGARVARVTMRYTNTLDPGAVADLSPSIAGVVYRRDGVPKGAANLLLFAYAPPGARILAASADGAPAQRAPVADGKQSVQRLEMAVPAGQTRQAGFDVLLPPGADKKKVQLLTTPGIANIPVAVGGKLDCSTVTLPQ